MIFRATVTLIIITFPALIFGADLISSVKTGGYSNLSILIDETANVNVTDRYGRTALHYAALNGDADAVSALILSGAEIDVSDDMSLYPLHLAAKTGNLEIIRLLIENGGDANVRTLTKGTAYKIAVAAESTAIADYLRPLLEPVYDNIFSAAQGGSIYQVADFLESGNHINDKDSENQASPLLWAVYGESLKVIEYLIDNGADIDSADIDGNTALHNACYEGLSDCAEFLIERGADVNTVNNNDETPLYNSVVRLKKRIMLMLLENDADPNQTDSDGYTVLHYSALFGRADYSKLLLENGADVNALGNDGLSPLHIADDSDIDLIELLIDYGANYYLPDNEGVSPFNRWAKAGNTELCDYLINEGADLNHCDEWGTPLQAAIIGGSIDMTEYFIEKGAGLTASESGLTTESAAIQSGNLEIVELIMENGGCWDTEYVCPYSGETLTLIDYAEILEFEDIENYLRALRLGYLDMIAR